MPEAARRPKRRPYTPRAHRRERRTDAGIPLPRIDGRTIGAMRYRALLNDYSHELGGVLSPAEKALVAQIASMQLRIEQLQGGIIEGRDVDADMIIRLSSEHRRLLTALRGKAGQRAEAQGTELDQYLAQHYSEPEAATEPEPTP